MCISRGDLMRSETSDPNLATCWEVCLTVIDPAKSPAVIRHQRIKHHCAICLAICCGDIS